MGEDWYGEPPWINDLPAAYAAHLRQTHPLEGTPRWQLASSGSLQCLLLAAILMEIRGAAGGFDPNG